MDDIEWRDVIGFEDYYMVSNTGLVFSKRACRLRKIRVNAQNGYAQLFLNGTNVKKMVYVHRLVAEAFIEKTPGLDFINHKDENKLNNNVSNLEWCTKRYNNLYNNKIAKSYKPIIQIDPYTREETWWESCIFPEKAKIANKKNISACCRGLRKHAGGYEWRYA